MKTLKIILAVVIILTILSLLPSIPFKKLVGTSRKSARCDQVNFLDFIKPLHDSQTYRVKNEYAPHGSVYQNAIVNFVWDYSTGGFLLFTCPRSSGLTCDVFKIEVHNRGNFSSGRNVFSEFQMKQTPQHTFGIEEDGETFYLCDPRKRLLSRFKLIPMLSKKSIDRSATICSTDYGNGYIESSGKCDKTFLFDILYSAKDRYGEAKIRVNTWNTISHKLKSHGDGLNKRLLFTSILLVVIVVIGIVFVAKKLNLWINKVQEAPPAEK